jgi:hypothetical protein
MPVRHGPRGARAVPSSGKAAAPDSAAAGYATLLDEAVQVLQDLGLPVE